MVGSFGALRPRSGTVGTPSRSSSSSFGTLRDGPRRCLGVRACGAKIAEASANRFERHCNRVKRLLSAVSSPAHKLPCGRGRALWRNRGARPMGREPGSGVEKHGGHGRMLLQYCGSASASAISAAMIAR